MPLTTEHTLEIVKAYGVNEKDTGSTSVQIALLSARIKGLTEHLKINKKDFATRRGLLMLVGQRRRLLRYYRDTHTADEYKTLITGLEIRK
ncbi:MAG: 30S ribosomal protein S15 [Vampirovibrio sp.]|jgi:small subunit ribosomal protein S15|nr:30S ribosomal protein S15 [Vampirovibrio sp.]